MGKGAIRIWQAAGLYFSIVFAAGFCLGVFRVMILVPAWGERYAELAELPVMLVVIAIAAHRIAHRWFRSLSRNQLCLAGMLALALLLTAELGLVLALQNASPAEYLQNRDPVSFPAYIVSIILFSLMPGTMRTVIRRA